ncbi:hypothetical protein ABDK56_02780 [Sphingomonas sp. ASV193]|uniref:hypothetical protein n=1 Tax=Sphingomonas sp. ASV193 TaxID=3144405 RepID=UPI0032E91737
MPEKLRGRCVNFQRWAIHGDLGILEAKRLWGGGAAYWSSWPIAAALALKDRLERKVVKTRLVFEANKNEPISVRILPKELDRVI